MSDESPLLNTRSLPCIVLHGGAGMLPGTPVPAVLEGIRAAARDGYAILEAGGSALDAVEAAVATLEDDVHFNAGRGSTLTQDGTVEMDASLMSGVDLESGACAAVGGVRHPIKLARRVMHLSDHVMLVGPGAERFAREAQEPFEAPEWFVTDAQHVRWKALVDDATARPDRSKLGTVGAVAVNRAGNVAAATSTGGTAFKRPGRVGDSPLIGCGTYADNASGSVSVTGHGEPITRLVLAKWVCDRMEVGDSPAQAARHGAEYLKERLEGAGGLISVAPDGRAGWWTNTPQMSRALMRPELDEPLVRM